MRTTVTIRDDLYEAVLDRATRDQRPFGDVLNEVIERGLDRSAPSRRPRLGEFRGQITIGDDFDTPMQLIDDDRR